MSSPQAAQTAQVQASQAQTAGAPAIQVQASQAQAQAQVQAQSLAVQSQNVVQAQTLVQAQPSIMTEAQKQRQVQVERVGGTEVEPQTFLASSRAVAPLSAVVIASLGAFGILAVTPIRHRAPLVVAPNPLQRGGNSGRRSNRRRR